MEQQAILGPVLGLVFVTALVWLTMLAQRARTLGKLKVPMEELGSRVQVNHHLGSHDGAGNNFLNLFEMPVLFYALAAVALAADKVTPILVPLGWVYVGLRAAQSFVHCTYNTVMHRFAAWMLSNLVLWAMWIIFGLSLRTGA